MSMPRRGQPHAAGGQLLGRRAQERLEVRVLVARAAGGVRAGVDRAGRQRVRMPSGTRGTGGGAGGGIPGSYGGTGGVPAAGRRAEARPRRPNRWDCRPRRVAVSRRGRGRLGPVRTDDGSVVRGAERIRHVDVGEPRASREEEREQHPQPSAGALHGRDSRGRDPHPPEMRRWRETRGRPRRRHSTECERHGGVRRARPRSPVPRERR